MKSGIRILLLALLASTMVQAGARKVSPDLQNLNPSATVDVIVQYLRTPNSSDHARIAGKGGRLRRELKTLRAASFNISAGALEALAEDAGVAYITPDRPVRATLDSASAAVNAGIARQYGFDGAGVGVAVIDSGIRQTPDFAVPGSGPSRVVYSESFVSRRADDEYGHGTHVAGIVAGNGAISASYRGIAPRASLVNLRVLGPDGAGFDSDVIAAIERAIQLKTRYNIRVINLSLGRPVYEAYALDPLCRAVEAAWKAGIVVVVAAGNYGRNGVAQGYGTIASPGNDPYVITVGATKVDGGLETIASYSSKGPTLIDHFVKPDIVAPGNRIVSALAPFSQLSLRYPLNIVPPAYFRLSGTSMATPMVSGAAALLLQKSPALTPDQVKATLMRTAAKSFPSYSTALDPATGRTYVSQHDIFTVGAGALDVWAALNSVEPAPRLALSPAVAYNGSSRTMSLVAGASLIWGESGPWSASIVWGGNVLLNSNSIVWGGSIVWGTSESIIWGTTVDALSLIWGGESQRESIIWGLDLSAFGEN